MLWSKLGCSRMQWILIRGKELIRKLIDFRTIAVFWKPVPVCGTEYAEICVRLKHILFCGIAHWDTGHFIWILNLNRLWRKIRKCLHFYCAVELTDLSDYGNSVDLLWDQNSTVNRTEIHSGLVTSQAFLFFAEYRSIEILCCDYIRLVKNYFNYSFLMVLFQFNYFLLRISTYSKGLKSSKLFGK